MKSVQVVRWAAAAAVAVALSACGAAGEDSGPSGAPAPIESAAGSGEVASALNPLCEQGPPASQRGFRVDGDAEHDGVVGTMRNETGYWVLVGSNREGVAKCYLAPGARLAYAGNYGVLIKLQWDSSDGESLWPSSFLPNSAWISMEDPDQDYPYVRISTGVRMYDDGCALDNVGRDLREGETSTLGGVGAGTVTATRLPDDKYASRDWTGRDSWAVNDWARIDLVLTPEKRCS